MELLIGTSNAGKLGEYRALLADLPARLLSLSDVGLDHMDVPEDADTLAANALAKAVAYSRASNHLTLADDTGLMVDALDGAPGIYPARYGGPGLTMAQRRHKLLTELDGVPQAQRTARFVCAIAIADPRSGQTVTVEGACAGWIAQSEDDGSGGFGYDALFIPQGYSIAWSSVPAADKNHISHRGQAARLAIPILRQWAGL